MKDEHSRPLERLLEIMVRLRAPGGCPWDAEQTAESLKPFILEEAYEVLEAIDSGDPALIQEELGDLLLQIVFQACIFEEQGIFGFSDVAAAIADKLVRRHPHVFADATIRDREALDALWDQIKEQEKAESERKAAPTIDVSATLPALVRAAKIADRARRLGVGDNLPLVRNAFKDFEESVRGDDPRKREEAFGTLLFSMVEMGRQMDIDAEEALRLTLNRFIRQSSPSSDPP